MSQMEGAGRILAYCSPLTYLVDLFSAAMSGTSAFSPVVDCSMLLVTLAGLVPVARVIQKRNLIKGL